MPINALLPDYSHWRPMSVESVRKQFSFEWILAGGLALEHFAGKSWRTHQDIDIIIKRSDQHKLLKTFEPARLFVAITPGTLSPFEDKYYDSPVQDIWVLSPDRQFWVLQVMLVDKEDQEWIYKRDRKIRLPWKDIYFEQEGLRVLKPEIQLLYKSIHKRPKDLDDLNHICPLLSDEAKQWLRENTHQSID